MTFVARMLLVTMLLSLGAISVLGAQSPFSINMTTSADLVRIGNPVEITMAITNTSGQSRAISVGDAEAYVFNIIDQTGRRITQKFPSSGGTIAMGSLKPEQTIIETVDVDKLYDLAAPGSYHIQVQRNLGGDIITSNVITVTVTE